MCWDVRHYIKIYVASCGKIASLCICYVYDDAVGCGVLGKSFLDWRTIDLIFRLRVQFTIY